MGTAGPRVQIVRRAWHNGALRRVCLATAGFRVAELAVWISLSAYAYAAGGVREASAVTVAQLTPATAFALVTGGLIRRHGAARVLRYGLLVQSAALVIVAVLLHEHTNAAAFATATLAASAVTTTRPTASVLTPGMVDGPDELTAANVLSGALGAAAGLVGPATAAVLMSAVGTWAVFAVMAAVLAGATAAVWRLPDVVTASDDEPDSLRADIAAIRRAPGPRIMVLALSACFVVIGALDVLAVVIAVELLHRTEAYAGYVTSAVGAGALVAGSVAFVLIGRRWIAPWIVVSGLAIGGALAAVSVFHARVAPSMLMLVVFGVASTLYELTATMLLQRVSRLDLIGRVFALVESLQMAMLAVGAAIVPVAVNVFGSRGAPAALGIAFAIVVAALGTRIVVIDRNARVPITEMAILRVIPLFAALPGAALETVAREARRIELEPGEVIVRQGDPGDHYFAVVSGRVMVAIDETDLRTLTRGDGFGEIALLRDVPRSATVCAIDATVVLVVDRQPFLTAVTGHAATYERASSIATAHLDR